ncbi:DUF5086 family protein [Ochrobactrum vermis]|uniref:DUF5086 family protein n=2 Tax=Ochrobactrum vermis TaxID=1827297 RepID=A0ABU8PM12_9HYPH
MSLRQTNRQSRTQGENVLDVCLPLAFSPFEAHVNKSKRMSKPLKPVLCLSVLGALIAAPVSAQQHQETIILSVASNIMRWADVYKVRPERRDDPYYHVRVIERQRDWKVWQFKELVSHMAVIPKALPASRISKKARTYNYKDVEIRSAYRRWLDEPETRFEVPVCKTNILNCLKQLPQR